MRQYELSVIFHPDLEADSKAAVAKVEKLIADNGGKINQKTDEGKKRLLYKISGQDHGVYFFFELDLTPASLNKISAVLNITPEVLRYILVSRDEKVVAEREKAKKEEE